MIPGFSPTQTTIAEQRLEGVYPAVVRDVQDPDKQGRVRVEFPFLPAQQASAAAPWALLATLMAGNGRGSWFIPEVNDEVLVAFMAGDPRHPVVIGSLWNGEDAAPERMDSNNNLRSITSRSGHKLSFDDSSGSEKVKLITSGGHSLTLDDIGGGTVRLSHSNGAELEIDSSGTILVRANSRVKVEAPAGLQVTAALVKVDAAISTFSGVVKCDALITNSVASASYTPGAGNVW